VLHGGSTLKAQPVSAPVNFFRRDKTFKWGGATVTQFRFCAILILSWLLCGNFNQ